MEPASRDWARKRAAAQGIAAVVKSMMSPREEWDAAVFAEVKAADEAGTDGETGFTPPA